MENVRVLEVKESVFANNDAHAEELRGKLRARGMFLLNLMSSPGSGKTTTLTKTIAGLKDELNIAVMEADIDSVVDAQTIAATGTTAIQIHTGGMCHLDAYMTQQGVEALIGSLDGPADKSAACGGVVPDLAILENVGNLVCPAEFDTGASANAMILSVPEGDDKPLKYPLMFSVCDVVLINKIDALPVFDNFDLERCRKNILERNPRATIIPISAKTGEGMELWLDWLREQVASWKQAQ